MRPSRPKALRLTLIVLAVMICAVTAALGLGYAIRGAGGRAKGAEDVRALIDEADYELSLGYHSRSLDRLAAAARMARREEDLLAVLKRARSIAAASGDYAPLARLSQIALERKPGSRRIGEIHVYAAVRADTGGKAVEWLSRLSGRPESEALVAEAYLRGRLRESDASRLSPETARLLRVIREREPQPLEEAARRHGDSRLWLDAGLAWMAAGQPRRAWLALQEAAALPSSREPAVYVAYDAGMYEQALQLIESLPPPAQGPEMTALAADAALLGGLPGAEERCRRVVEAWPGHSWTAYLNLAHLREGAGDRQSARDLRAAAYELFPGVEAVALSHVAELQLRGDPDAARGVVESFLAREPDSVAGRLRLLDLEGMAAAPVVYTAALWKLLREHPGEGALCRTLVLYLVELRDYAGAEMALSEYERAAPAGGRPWVEEYRAVLAAAQGNLAEAEAAMMRSIELEPTWTRHHNLGLLLGARGRRKEAIDALRIAEELLLRGGSAATGASGEDGDAQRSRVRALIGEQLAALEDFQGARRECEYALDLDPRNHRARLVLRLLEGR